MGKDNPEKLEVLSQLTFQVPVVAKRRFDHLLVESGVLIKEITTGREGIRFPAPALKTKLGTDTLEEFVRLGVATQKGDVWNYQVTGCVNPETVGRYEFFRTGYYAVKNAYRMFKEGPQGDMGAT